ncbi:MAG: polysaccharide deacetylase family protein [Flavobacteriales bacterium]|nr:polysaccharide deacetylase family protein [Flavobacteriales bacterium]
MTQISVLLAEPTPRAEQAVRWVLNNLLGCAVRLVATEDELIASDGAKLHYGSRAIPEVLNIRSSGWLKANGISPFEPPTGSMNGIPVLFPSDEGDLPFDVFAATFFLLSRYEEWSGLPSDEHGRPLTDSLHASRHGYLHRPVVDEWARELKEAWKRFDPGLEPPASVYRQITTVDLDNGFKYLGRPLWRTIGSTMRDAIRGNWKDLRERFRVLTGRSNDPFLLDEEARSVFNTCSDRVIHFVLSASRGEWDHAVPVDHPAYASALRSYTNTAEIGIHPSYNTSAQPGLAAKEIRALQHVIQRPIKLSRQHFLRLKVPATFREMEKLGIREEHSMGIHDRIGFRCGTCTPYPWYDPEQERATELMIHPFTVMDNTLCHKLGLSPEEAIIEVRAAVDRLKRIGGTFTGLWHESFLASTGANTEWREAILRIIQEARP